MIKVFGIPHYPTANDYSAKIIMNEKPKVVCVELHQSVVDDLIRVIKLATRNSEEEEFYRAEAGDGIVTIIESAWKVGAEIYGIEPKRGYNIHKSDYKTGLQGWFWNFMEKSWGIIAGYVDRRGERNPDMYQSSFWAHKAEDVRRWIWKHQCFPAYKRVSLEREKTYASRLVALQMQSGEAKIFFFVGGGHKWNTLKEVQDLSLFRQKCLDIIRKEIRELSARSEVIGIFLGGSLFKGTEWQTSDIDLGLILEKQFDPEPALSGLVKGIPITRWRAIKDDIQRLIDNYPESWYDTGTQWQVGWYSQSQCLYDRGGFAKRLLSFITNHRYDPAIVGKYVKMHIQQAENELEGARALRRSQRLGEAYRGIRQAFDKLSLAILEYAKIPLDHKELEQQVLQIESLIKTPGLYDLYGSIWCLTLDEKGIESLYREIKAALAASVEMISQATKYHPRLEDLGIESMKDFLFPYEVGEYENAITDYIRFIGEAFDRGKYDILPREAVSSYLFWLDETTLQPLKERIGQTGIELSKSYGNVKVHLAEAERILGWSNPSEEKIEGVLRRTEELCAFLIGP